MGPRVNDTTFFFLLSSLLSPPSLSLHFSLSSSTQIHEVTSSPPTSHLNPRSVPVRIEVTASHVGKLLIAASDFSHQFHAGPPFTA